MEEERQPIEYGYGRSSTLYQDYDYEKIDKFTLKEEMSNAINPILEEWGYELLE